MVVRKPRHGGLQVLWDLLQIDALNVCGLAKKAEWLNNLLRVTSQPSLSCFFCCLFLPAIRKLKSTFFFILVSETEGQIGNVFLVC